MVYMIRINKIFYNSKNTQIHIIFSITMSQYMKILKINIVRNCVYSTFNQLQNSILCLFVKKYYRLKNALLLAEAKMHKIQNYYQRNRNCKNKSQL